MARGTSEKSSPAPASAGKKAVATPRSTKGQQSILGFFGKTVNGVSGTSAQDLNNNTMRSLSKTDGSGKKLSAPAAGKPVLKKGSNQTLTPAPSSDAISPSSPEKAEDEDMEDSYGLNSLPSPPEAGTEEPAPAQGTPSRKAKKIISYAESDDDNVSDEDDFKPAAKAKPRGRALKKRRTMVDSDSEDEFKEDMAALVADLDEDEMDDFIVPDDSDEDVAPSRKRKRPQAKVTRREPTPELPPSLLADDDIVRTGSTATQWKYDPDNIEPLHPRSDSATNSMTRRPTLQRKGKEKAHLTEPEKRYPWLASVTDIDRNPPGHPDYDPRTIYIPPMAWTQFSPFEKQYWEIKQKFWDTIVFFKKGKFYELYENDATIGHQLFDLKLTDRVNMRMVGVPEASLEHWANQFVAKGFKIARVDQSETALGKEMRERDGKGPGKIQKQDKVIRRELACVLTAGTLVDGGMLQDDMSTFCVSIKESVVDDLPAFGISFVDTATAQFFMTEFVDDADMTKFETFIAQTRPQELILEKGAVSVKTLRILKNNTSTTTIWNYLKPGKEFWDADITLREIDASGYFESEESEKFGAWPLVLQEVREKDLVISAFGALVWYLRMLKIERELVTLGNFSWYDPIKKATSLVLDGQTLINLEIFANTFDGGSTGTLFSLLNRCTTPFGKRTFKQWVCHPLADPVKINARLDAVEALNADYTIMDRFTSSLTKLPDLERLISRVHAGICKAQDFVKVLEGFEQIEYTMSLLGQFGSGEGVLGQLIASMPDLNPTLQQWKTAFDRSKAKEEGLLIPETGVEEDFDASQLRIETVLGELDNLLKKVRRELGSSSIVYRDNGKEIYQLEVPSKIKNIPKSWDQMSATQKVKRYYSPELRILVRQLQEAQETHSQIVKEVAGRFFQRFDHDYEMWLKAVKIVAQLDCLISLAKASSALGEPSCRPVFVDDDRSVLQFEDLRHPCMLPTVMDFIPNDVALGGNSAKIDLLTGANAAGKSTVLRMTCVAVIMAQLGCYVPCKSAHLTPVDRIMSRLGANDNIFAAQSTFFVELSETKKILSEATPRSLVILDELGRGTSSYDGVAVAQAVLHHIATHIGCIGFFATHYHSLATEFAGHPEIAPKRMQIQVDETNRRVTFLYKLEDGVAEGSFGMHCAAMCGIPAKVIDRAEVAAKEWEHTSRLKESLEKARSGCYVPLGIQSDISWLLKDTDAGVEKGALDVLMAAIKAL